MWTIERVEVLKKRWADGLSATQIAAELGGVSRNAVIGKIHRIGCEARAKEPPMRYAPPSRASLV
jgi:GcrA cell cycle regulator